MESVRVRTRRVTSLILQSTTYPASVTTTTMASQDSSNTVLFTMMMHYKESMEAAQAASARDRTERDDALLSEARVQSEALALQTVLDEQIQDNAMFLNALRERNRTIERQNIELEQGAQVYAQLAHITRDIAEHAFGGYEDLRRDATRPAMYDDYLGYRVRLEDLRYEANKHIESAAGVHNYIKTSKKFPRMQNNNGVFVDMTSQQSGDYITRNRNICSCGDHDEHALMAQGDEIIDLTGDSDDDMESGEETETDEEEE